MNIAEEVWAALWQFSLGPTIGRRKTPVFSVWPMREKWRNRPVAWAFYGTDGDIIVRGATVIIPATLRLVYIKTHDDRVLQMAYETCAESVFGLSSIGIAARSAEYDRARESPFNPESL